MLSIVINNYNYAAYLGEAIESALAQSVADMEVVVVDDGSTDDSRAVIEGFGDRIRSVFKENGGQASAFNAGFAAAARGDWIVFLDADDVLASNAAAVALAAAIAEGKDVVSVQFMLRVVDGERVPVSPPRTMPIFQFDGDPVASMLKRGTYKFSPTSGNLFSRSVLAKILPMQEEEFRLCADAYLQSCVPFHGKVVFLPEVLGDYRVHESNNHFNKRAVTLDGLARSAFYRHQKLKTIRREAARFELSPDSFFDVQDCSLVFREWAVRRLYKGERFRFDDESKLGVLRRLFARVIRGAGEQAFVSNLGILVKTSLAMFAPPFLWRHWFGLSD